jgi:hypothetical protein
MLVWIVRGYFLSGYPLYPLTAGALSVDWQMPVEFAEGEARAIYLWSRHRSMDPLGDDWLWTWLLGLSRLWAVYPVLVTLFMAIVYGAARWFSRTNAISPAQAKHDWKPIAAASTPPILGLFFWWLTAPDPRFARSLFAFLPLLMAYILLQRLEQNGWGKPRWNQVGVLLLVYLAVGATFAVDAGELMQIPAGFAEMPSAEISTHILPTGLRLNVPVDDDRCWNAPLPCAPYVILELQLRGSDLQQGFAIASP